MREYIHEVINKYVQFSLVRYGSRIPILQVTHELIQKMQVSLKTTYLSLQLCCERAKLKNVHGRTKKKKMCQQFKILSNGDRWQLS